MDTVQGGGDRPSRPTYIHELNNWPDFRSSEEVIKQPLGLVSGLQRQIVADSSNMGRAKATETTVRNLTNSALASSRIEEEYPDPNAVKAAIRRRIVAVPPGTDQGEPDEPGIAAVTADAAQNCGEPLTADRLHLLAPPAVPKPEPCQLHGWPMARRPTGPNARRLNQLRGANHRPLRSPGR